MYVHLVAAERARHSEESEASTDDARFVHDRLAHA
jgi:hypothetical protein